MVCELCFLKKYLRTECDDRALGFSPHAYMML